MALTPQGAASIARAAKELLIENGWCPDRLMDDAGRMCLMGAVNQAVTGSWRYPHFLIADMTTLGEFAAAFNRARQQLFPGDFSCSCRICFDSGICGIVEFNNADGRAPEHIHQVLDALQA